MRPKHWAVIFLIGAALVFIGLGLISIEFEQR